MYFPFGCQNSLLHPALQQLHGNSFGCLKVVLIVWLLLHIRINKRFATKSKFLLRVSTATVVFAHSQRSFECEAFYQAFVEFAALQADALENNLRLHSKLAGDNDGVCGGGGLGGWGVCWQLEQLRKACVKYDMLIKACPLPRHALSLGFTLACKSSA